MNELEGLKFPIGQFKAPESYSVQQIREWTKTIEQFPSNIQSEVSHLSDVQLDTAYRPEGWTIRQVVHHCADSHMNALIRFKLTITEGNPTIKPYREDLWAVLDDYKFPVGHSLKLLELIHEKWVVILQSMEITDFEKEYIHPEYGLKFRLNIALANYDWHCKHHLAHITQLKESKGW